MSDFPRAMTERSERYLSSCFVEVKERACWAGRLRIPPQRWKPSRQSAHPTLGSQEDRALSERHEGRNRVILGRSVLHPASRVHVRTKNFREGTQGVPGKVAGDGLARYGDLSLLKPRETARRFGEPPTFHYPVAGDRSPCQGVLGSSFFPLLRRRPLEPDALALFAFGVCCFTR